MCLEDHRVFCYPQGFAKQTVEREGVEEVCKQKVQKTKRAGTPENTGVTRMAGPKSGSRRLYPTFAVQQHREHSGPEIIPAPACLW